MTSDFGMSALLEERQPIAQRKMAAEAVLEDAEKRSSEAHQILDAALKETARFRDELNAARDAYAENQNDEAVKEIRSAREKFELAELRESKPRQAAIEADRARDAAALAVAGALSELAAVDRKIRIAELRKQASLDVFREAIKEPSRKVLEAREALRAAAAELDEVLKTSHEASRELQKEGVDCAEATPLAHVHLLQSFFDARFAVEPNAGLCEKLNLNYMTGAPLMNALGPNRPAAASMNVWLLDEIATAHATGDHARAVVDKFMSRRIPHAGDLATPTAPPKPSEPEELVKTPKE